MAAEQRVIDALAATDLFRDVQPRALQRIANVAKVVQHSAGKSFTEGTPGIGFHLILDGEVEVQVGSKPVKTMGPGEYFGEISLIDKQPRSATVTAKTDVTTASLVAWDFEPLLLEEPSVTKALLLVMVKRLRSAETG